MKTWKTFLDYAVDYAGRDRNECWLWTGNIAEHGYGTARSGKRFIYAHRGMYEVHRGRIPEGLVLDHLCRVRHCVNPWHLEPVSIAENVARGFDLFEPKTRCKNGHEAKVDRPSGRVCLECDRAAGARYRARQRLQSRAGK